MPPLRPTPIRRRKFGAVAQLGERCVRNAEVGGSTPLRSTTEALLTNTVGKAFLLGFVQFARVRSVRLLFVTVCRIPGRDGQRMPLFGTAWCRWYYERGRHRACSFGCSHRLTLQQRGQSVCLPFDGQGAMRRESRWRTTDEPRFDSTCIRDRQAAMIVGGSVPGSDRTRNECEVHFGD